MVGHDLKRARDAGKRRDHEKRMTPFGVLSDNEATAESRLNVTQMHAIDVMYESNPAVRAARGVLFAQLCSSGLQVVRNGKPLQAASARGKGSVNEITPNFSQHLEKYWMPFARQVIDSLLKFGVAPVAFTVTKEETMQMGMSRLKAEHGIASPRRRVLRKPTHIIPFVPHRGTYQIAWRGVELR